MSESNKLVGVLHLTDEELARKALEAMNEMGIRASYTAASEIPEDEFPEFMEKTSEGWVFFIDKARFNEGMTRLGELMGYTQD